MGKANKTGRSSAVRKIDPVDQVTELVPRPEVVPVTGSGTGSETVLESSTAVVPTTAGRPGVNPIASAGYTIEGLSGEHKTKSGVIRFLASKGFETKHIAVFMGIRYQHVRNVLTTQLKKPVTVAVVAPAGAGSQTEEIEETE